MHGLSQKKKKNSCSLLNRYSAGLSCGGMENIEKVLSSEIGVQDFKKVLNLANMYIKYCNSKFSHFLNSANLVDIIMLTCLHYAKTSW